eukprot:4718896-Pleurochrysis_carterae.AAC.3
MAARALPSPWWLMAALLALASVTTDGTAAAETAPDRGEQIQRWQAITAEASAGSAEDGAFFPPLSADEWYASTMLAFAL